MTNSLMSKVLAEKDQELSHAKALLEASNAHCTIMKCMELDARTELLNKKNKSHHTVKMSARYVAHDMMRELHASQTLERAKHAKEAAEKEAWKAEEGAACNAQIQEEIKTRIFTGVWSLYSHF
jgi:outer membrane receptor for Fe3+-dicitrate